MSPGIGVISCLDAISILHLVLVGYARVECTDDLDRGQAGLRCKLIADIKDSTAGARGERIHEVRDFLLILECDIERNSLATEVRWLALDGCTLTANGVSKRRATADPVELT